MLEQTLQIAAVSVSQMALVFLKHVGLRVIVAKQVRRAMFYTFFIQASWLISSAIGINALVKGNYVVVVFYLAAAKLFLFSIFRKA
jgi:hypothetical protein